VTTVVKTPTGLEFTYTRNRNAFNDDYLFAVEHSDNLIAPGTSVGAGAVVIDGDQQTVKANVPAGPLGRRFIRLRTSPPAAN
jgi:hypothetical protein